MGDLVIWGGAVVLLGCGASWLRRSFRNQKELYVLQKKYGDLPMFDEFFRRVQAERRSRKGRVS